MRTPGRIWSTIAVVGVLALAGCGGGDDDEPQGSDLTTLRCPLVADGEVGGITQYRPADDAFDTAELIGVSLEAAGDTAGEHGCEVVVAKRDGAGVAVPADVDPERIYVYTEDGVVTQIEGVGGGL